MLIVDSMIAVIFVFTCVFFRSEPNLFIYGKEKINALSQAMPSFCGSC